MRSALVGQAKAYARLRSSIWMRRSALAIGVRRVGPRPHVAEPQLLAARPPSVRSVRGAIADHHRFDRWCPDHRRSAAPARRRRARRGGGQASTIGVGQPRVFVEGDVHVLPGCASPRRRGCACRRSRSAPTSWCRCAATSPTGGRARSARSGPRLARQPAGVRAAAAPCPRSRPGGGSLLGEAFRERRVEAEL